jgi:hypothetical protein
MSTLLDKAREKVVVLPQDEQDAIASQILASLADEDAWKKAFNDKRDVIRRMEQKPLKKTRGARRYCSTLYASASSPMVGVVR